MRPAPPKDLDPRAARGAKPSKKTGPAQQPKQPTPLEDQQAILDAAKRILEERRRQEAAVDEEAQQLAQIRWAQEQAWRQQALHLGPGQGPGVQPGAAAAQPAAELVKTCNFYVMLIIY